VSASAICPGFITAEDGMYSHYVSAFGATAPKAVGDMPVEAVGKAVVNAVEKDLPDVIVMRGAPRALAAASIAMPRMFERMSLAANLSAPFRMIADQRRDRRGVDG